MDKKKQPSKAKIWLLAIGIAIVFAMFVSYGIRTFSPEPQYDKYCNSTRIAVLNLSSQEECVKVGGQWTNTQYYEKPQPAMPIQAGYCDPDFTCRQGYEAARVKFEDRAFIITIVAGFLGIVMGIILSMQSISFGFLLGGIINLFIGTVSYWGRFQNIIKFVILGAVLLLLLWIGWKKLR
jgi:hypothetical protein